MVIPPLIYTIIKNSFYKNSFYILITSMISSIFGFIFWIIAAKFYTPDEVGIASAIISSMTLILLFSKFGLDQAIIRFFPEMDKKVLLWSSVVVSVLFSIIFSIIFILGLEIWSPDLMIIKSFPLEYILLVTVYSILSILGAAFIAMRMARLYFIQNLITGTRIIFLYPLVILGSFGIFASFGLSLIISALFSVYFILRVGVKFCRYKFSNI